MPDLYLLAGASPSAAAGVSLAAGGDLDGNYPDPEVVSLANVTGVGKRVAIRRTGDHAGVTASTAVVDDGVLQVDIGANETWIIEAHLAITASSAGSHRETFTCPVGAAGIIHWSGNTTYFAAYGTDLGEAAQPVVSIYMRTMVANGANAGTVKVRYAQFASDGTATIMKAGSFITGLRIA